MSGFRLDVVLRLRKIAEDNARSRLGDALTSHREVAVEVEELARDLGSERAQLGALQLAAATPAGDLRDAHDGVEFGERAVVAATGRLEDAAHLLFESRATLATASRRREVVERLRDRARLAARRTAEHKVEVEMAEFATIRHAWAEIEESLQ
jgi:flagellar export protein FliJ